MRALVTGCEGSLGGTIKARLERDGWSVTNIPGSIIRDGQRMIEARLMMESAAFAQPFDILINNFGINHLSWIGTTGHDGFDDEAIFRCNVMGPYWIVNWLVQHSPKPMRVINIASQTYRVAQRTTTLYCASKAALVQMTKVMARELAPSGWIINAIAPGKIEDTEMATMTDRQVEHLRQWTKVEADAYALTNVPMGRFTDRNEVADAIMKLIQMPSYVNGTVLDMTGGV